MAIVDTSFHGHHIDSFHSVVLVKLIIITIAIMMVYIHLSSLIGILYVAQINHILGTNKENKRYFIKKIILIGTIAQ